MPMVYFIGVQDFVKIGFSTDPERRMLKEMQPYSPHEMKILRTIEGCTRGHEAWLHRQFRDLHIHHEWFQFSADMLTIEVPQVIDRSEGTFLLPPVHLLEAIQECGDSIYAMPTRYKLPGVNPIRERIYLNDARPIKYRSK